VILKRKTLSVQTPVSKDLRQVKKPI